MTHPVLSRALPADQGILCSAPTALGQLKEFGLLKCVLEILKSLRNSSDFCSVMVLFGHNGNDGDKALKLVHGVWHVQC